MALVYTVNGTEIDSRYIREHYNSTSHVSYDGKIITPELSLVLDNTDLSVWDDSNPASLLGAWGWWNTALTIYDTELKAYVWDGLLRNVSVDDGNRTITLYSVHRLDESKQLANIDDLTGKSPAEIIYDLLIQIGIDEDYIVQGGFDAAIAIQEAAGVGIRIQYEDDDAIEVKAVIEELCTMTQCAVYSVDNYVHLAQWQAWTGDLGTRVQANKIITGSYSSEYVDDPIYNEYYVAYEAGGSIAFATGGTDSSSQTTHGRKVYSIPEGAFDADDDPGDVSLLLDSKAGADWVGALAVSRYSQPRKRAKAKVFHDLDYLALGDQVDLDFRLFQREPVQIISKKVTRDKRQIEWEVEFLNFPVERYDRDTTAPAKPAKVFVYPYGGGYLVKWNACSDTDYLGSRVYFTVSDNYVGEVSRQGASPVDHKPTDYTTDGYRYKVITGIGSTAHKFRVSNYDDSFNESDLSHIVEAGYAITGYLNRYRVEGNPYVDGITPAQDNPFRGTVLDEWLTYEDAVLPFTLSPGCVYESDALYSPTGWTAMSWLTVGQYNRVQYRTSSDGTTWSAWSAETNALAAAILALPGDAYLQYRVILSPESWADDDYFFIRGLA